MGVVVVNRIKGIEDKSVVIEVKLNELRIKVWYLKVKGKS
jgi:hypothetical protein